MTQIPKTRICLAMLVRDEQAIIERALRSVKPWIDAWCIHDLGSQDESPELIKRQLRNLPGKLHRGVFINYSESRNRLLLDAAQQLAQLPQVPEQHNLILMLDADEELWCFGDPPQLPEGIDIGIIDILDSDVVLRQPRLFRATALPRFIYPVNEQIEDVQGDQTCLLDSLNIRHHRDGVRHRDEALWQRDSVVTDAWLSNLPDTPHMLFTRAQLQLRQNQSELALSSLGQVVALEDHWQAAYLAARICVAEKQDQQALEWLQRCVDIDPDRPEAVLQLARLHYKHADLSAAEQLATLILDSEVSTAAHYYEPLLYRSGVRLLLAEVALANEQPERITELLNPLNAHFHLTEAENQLSTRLKEQAQTQLAARTTPAVTDQADIGSEESPAPADDAPAAPMTKLTIGMATYDDYHGVYFSILSLYLYHFDALDDVEILVVDNNPDSDHGEATRGLCDRIPIARYVAAGEYKGTAVRELIFSLALGDSVVCMDCHVFLHAGVVARLKEYFAANPDSRDLLHGPLFFDNHTQYSTHMKPDWNAGFYGTWGTDERGKDSDADGFEIPLQGMGLFACNKKHWLGFNHRFRGFGGEEGYIHEKYRQAGAKVLCLPFLRWTHRFDRPGGTPYANRWHDRIRNYLLGWHELGLDMSDVLEHFRYFGNPMLAAQAHAAVLMELQGPFIDFDTVYAVAESDETWQSAEQHITELAMQAITQRLSDEQPLPKLMEMATTRALPNVLLINAEYTDPTDLTAAASKISQVSADNNWDLLVADVDDRADEGAFQLVVLRPNAYPALADYLQRGGTLAAMCRSIEAGSGHDPLESALAALRIRKLT